MFLIPPTFQGPPVSQELPWRCYLDGSWGLQWWKSPSPDTPGLRWWRPALGSTAQLLLVGIHLQSELFWLWPKAKNMLNMLALQVNHLREGQGAGHTPHGWVGMVALLKNCPDASLRRCLTCSPPRAVTMTAEVPQLYSTQTRSRWDWPWENRQMDTDTSKLRKVKLQRRWVQAFLE